jgi:hypothetical protein
MSEPIIMPAFHTYHIEAASIGRLLAGYGELEFLLARCVSVATGDLSTAGRVLYRSRSEEHRISSADALLMPHYEKYNLVEIWQRVRRGLSWCKGTRNQFSHCQWLNDPGGLFFTNVEKGAKSVSGKIKLEFFHVDTVLLTEHERHFRWTGDGLCYLHEQHSVLAGRPQTHTWPVPAERQPPPRHNPPEKHSIQSQAEFHVRLQSEKPREIR